MIILEFLKVKFTVLVLLHNFIVGEPGEGRPTQYHHVEYHPQAKQIASGRVRDPTVALQVGNLRRDVSRSAAPREQQLLAACAFGQSEVSDDALVLATLAKEDVLGFNVPMHIVEFMHVLQSQQNTLHNHPNFLRGKLVSVLYPVVESSA